MREDFADDAYDAAHAWVDQLTGMVTPEAGMVTPGGLSTAGGEGPRSSSGCRWSTMWL